MKSAGWEKASFVFSCQKVAQNSLECGNVDFGFAEELFCGQGLYDRDYRC